MLSYLYLTKPLYKRWTEQWCKVPRHYLIMKIISIVEITLVKHFVCLLSLVPNKWQVTATPGAVAVVHFEKPWAIRNMKQGVPAPWNTLGTGGQTHGALAGEEGTGSEDLWKRAGPGLDREPSPNPPPSVPHPHPSLLLHWIPKAKEVYLHHTRLGQNNRHTSFLVRIKACQH